ncbi:MAG: chorismate synthase [Acidobacteria bacterium]|nr:chorismate synthase [Acidobacteriota bacterium]
MFFKFTTAGESHGKALVAIVEGLPAGMLVETDFINHELWRRQQGYGRGGRMKIESDTVDILSGVRHGRTLGSPVSLVIENKDFSHWEQVMSSVVLEIEPKNPRIVKRPRPGHADLAGGQKFQTRDLRNVLERASARETAARVACGAFAKLLLTNFGVNIKSHVIKLGAVPTEPLEKTWAEISAIDKNSPLACADVDIEAQMMIHIDEARENGDTLGGIFEIVAKNILPGLGSHTSWYEKLDGRIARAIMSIQAVKAVEIGTGVANSGRFGSAVHDEIFYEDDKFNRRTNRAGGLEGGITNGEELRVRGYLKPISTLRKALHSVDIDSKADHLAAFERSDITAVPAAGVIGEAMLALVIANAMREKFGGDSIDEMKDNFERYRDRLAQY